VYVNSGAVRCHPSVVGCPLSAIITAVVAIHRSLSTASAHAVDNDELLLEVAVDQE
jgi:hypothetical protein